MLAVACKAADGISFTQGGAERLAFPEATFDLVLSTDVIHHVADRPAHFREAFRVLKPGGRICTVTDSEDVIRRRRPLSSHFPETIAVELARYPAIPDLQAIMQSSGFVGINEDVVEQAYHLTDIAAYRDKAFSALHLIADEAFQRGIAAMERDLRAGPLPCVSLYAMLWGSKPRQ
jgi:ubiquinone/menaquinone biosynthesis C-methylase UbiE